MSRHDALSLTFYASVLISWRWNAPRVVLYSVVLAFIVGENVARLRNRMNRRG